MIMYSKVKTTTVKADKKSANRLRLCVSYMIFVLLPDKKIRVVICTNQSNHLDTKTD